MENNTHPRNRILVIDDEVTLLKLIEETLTPSEFDTSEPTNLQGLGGNFSDQAVGTIESPYYEITTCTQGEEGVEEIKRSVIENRPFSLVFLDMRMPPGKDGVWTAKEIRKYDEMVNILILTGYTDIDPAELSVMIPPKDKLLYTQKPLRPREIRQFAAAICAKWQNEKDLFEKNLELLSSRKKLENMYELKSRELDNTSKVLTETEESLQKSKQELTEKAIAMKVLMKDIAMDHNDIRDIEKEMDEKILLNIKELTEPFIRKLSETGLSEEQLDLLSILHKNLEKVTSPAMRRLYSTDTNLTPAEIQVANLIKQGKTTKQIADLLNLSTRTIEFHRDNIRKKLGITDRKTNLKTVIQSL